MIAPRLSRTLAVFLALFALGAAPAPAEQAVPAQDLPSRVFSEASPSVVGIRVWTRDGGGRREPNAFGTGTIIHPLGLVLTSITVVPGEPRAIEVRLPGGRTVSAEKVAAVPEKEIVVLRLERGKDSGQYPSVRLGSSGRVRVGELAFALGNSYHSIEEDEQISFTAGAISGWYTLTETRNESRYKGPALETTAAVTDGMDGGPLLDSRCRLLGLLSLNYSRSRWLGIAVPIDILKPLIAEAVGWFGPGVESLPVHAGLELLPASIAAGLPAGTDAGRRAEVTWVEEGGPAARAGLVPGDRILSWNGEALAGPREFSGRFAGLSPGARIRLEVERDGARREVELVPWGRF